jgi:hypothetical protein
MTSASSIRLSQVFLFDSRTVMPEARSDASRLRLTIVPEPRYS